MNLGWRIGGPRKEWNVKEERSKVRSTVERSKGPDKQDSEWKSNSKEQKPNRQKVEKRMLVNRRANKPIANAQRPIAAA